MANLIVSINAAVDNAFLDLEELRAFNRESNLLGNAYTNNIGEIKIKDLQKITILLSDHRTLKETTIRPNFKGNSVCVIISPFDFVQYFAKSEAEKVRILLEEIKKAVMKASQELAWNSVPFEEAYLKTLSLESFADNYELRISASSPKRLRAGIGVSFTPKSATIYLLIKDKNGNVLKKVEVFKALAHVMYIARVVGKLKWLSEEEVVLTNPTEEINFKASLLHDNVEVFFTPKSNTIEFLLNEFKTISADKEEADQIIERKLIPSSRSLN